MTSDLTDHVTPGPLIEWEGDARLRQHALHERLTRDTYRVVVRGGFVGPSYDLEMRHRFFPWIQQVALALGPPEPGVSEDLQLHRVALQAIAQCRGAAAAQRARIRMIWDGSL